MVTVKMNGSLLLTLCLVAGVFSACDHGWTESCSGTCLRHYDSKETYNSAVASCRAIGAELVTLPTITQIIFFRGFLAHIGELNTGIWLGGNKLSGTWQWDGLDKSAIKDVGGDQWIHGQPDDAWGGEDCLQSHNWGSLWNDLGCNHHLEYVCEKSHPYQ